MPTEPKQTCSKEYDPDCEHCQAAGARRIVMRLYAKVKAAEPVLALLEREARFLRNYDGGSHWEGCESSHRHCAVAKEMEAVIDAYRRVQ